MGNRLAAAVPWLRPKDPPSTVYEFFSPFAHIKGRFEWCRIRSPTHGVFDTFVRLGPSAEDPATVYVSSREGASFMADRYPQCEAIRVAPGSLKLEETQRGRRVEGKLRSRAGPVRQVNMVFRAPATARLRNVPYGGQAGPVWGNPRLTCWGVDLVLDAQVHGRVVSASGEVETFRATPGLLTLGSFGRIAPR